jgi:acylphosphatase
MKEKARVHIFLSGLVQGVFFRAYTREKAQELSLTGWVQNLPDGRLEAVFEGDREKIKKVVDWAKIGPPRAQVADLKVELEEYRGEFNTFQIR